MQNTSLSKLAARKGTIAALALTVLLGVQVNSFAKIARNGIDIDAFCSKYTDPVKYAVCVDGGCAAIHIDDPLGMELCVYNANVAHKTLKVEETVMIDPIRVVG